MTREEAIKILEEEAEFLYGGDEPYNKIAFEMAIEALQTEPVCEHFYKGYCNRFEDGCFQQCQAEPKHGKWIKHENPEGVFSRECSKCKCWFPWDMPRNSFCPNCGAKMDKELFG